MAEVVERNLEESYDEFSHIRRAKLFNEDEIREIIRRRRQHEYSLQKRNKRITDFDSYISTEIGILRLVSIRRQKTFDFRFNDKIEKSIISRLVRLHKQVCYRFQSRIDVWIRFIWFNRVLGRHMSVVRLWDRLLQVHGRSDPRLWASAAAFHLDEGARAQARSALAKLSTELRAIKEAKRKVARLRKTPSCTIEGAALHLETGHLGRLQLALGRQVRLTWDRAMLQGLREARSLLTQGLAFNENSAFLLLELAKLEASAIDFFTKRILLRRKQAAWEKPAPGEEHVVDVEMKKEGDAETVKRRRLRAPDMTDKHDAISLLAEVTENIDFITTGGAIQLVLERFITFDDVSAAILSSVVEIAKKVSATLVGEELIEKLNYRLGEVQVVEEIKNKALTNQIAEGEIKNEGTTALLLRTAFERTSELRRILNKDSVESALAAWNSWYPKTESLRLFDPSKAPELIALITARLEIVSVSQRQKPSTAVENSGDDLTTVLLAYNNYRLTHEARIQAGRDLLDSLTTSTWGSKSSEFWRLFIEYERKLGDCTRIPALQWRAEKTLEEAARTKFLQAAVNKNDDFF